MPTEYPLETFDDLQKLVQGIFGKFNRVRYYKHEIEGKNSGNLVIKFIYLFEKNHKKTVKVPFRGEYGPGHSIHQNMVNVLVEYLESTFQLERRNEEKKEDQSRGLDLLRTLW